MATLDYGQLVQGVEMTAGLDREAAERTIQATLATLAERLSQDELAALAARLPAGFQEALSGAGSEPEPFPPEEFVRRVATRIGIDQSSAWDRVRLVLATLRQSLAEMEQVRGRLQDYDALMT